MKVLVIKYKQNKSKIKFIISSFCGFMKDLTIIS